MVAVNALLVDDHALFRDGLALLLNQRFPEVHVDQADDLAGALRRLAEQPPIELVLLDLGLRDSEGVGSLARVLKLCPEVSVVVLSADDRPETVEAALAAGASGFIPKTSRGGVIDEALRVVTSGGVYLPRNALVAARLQQVRAVPAVATGLHPLAMAVHEDAPVASSPLDLSARQLDVLRYMVEGLSSKNIGRELELAESTVKSHILVIFRKLGVESRAQAVLAAVRLGLVPNHFA
jgi:DNA-binding NarL/FixJ family response regulator